jgi:urease accessory protein
MFLRFGACVRLAALAALMWLGAGSAEAHTFGAHGAAFGDGFSHPFGGIDHLLAMVAVGLWAGGLSGRAVWLVPAAFVTTMALSAVAAMLGGGLSWGEPAIALSVLGLGLLIAFRARLGLAAATATVAVFASFHGFAHGAEAPEAAAPAGYLLGFVLATGILHALGVGLALLCVRRQALIRVAGGAVAVAGVMLVAAL